ncbi:MAG: hypothetical protein K0S75_837 [Clostridia bacterium]|jgi:hypothetical protein|nr:hypothetical protein [Clostridia bacterium]
MDYKKELEEQIETLKTKQKELQYKPGTASDMCKIAETIIQLVDKASAYFD